MVDSVIGLCRMEILVFCPVGITVFSSALIYFKEVDYKSNVSFSILVIGYNVLAALSIWLCCFIGQKLENSMEELLEAFCSQNWYLMSYGNRKMLRLIIMRCQRIRAVGFGSLIQMNYKLFLQIARVAWSIGTCVIGTRNK
ncbi:hypothetical protein HHI36_016413 [Cryptolaemus montrouzieri]|uniref:Uncharacterized protein n=1 Tax=Cryptolaemus montrouzieri TaxID=559131 RepID=A0ABD2NK43_9CUCU